MRLIRFVSLIPACVLLTTGLAAQSFEKVPETPAAAQTQTPAPATAARPTGGIAIINIQAALIGTQEGQQGAQALQQQFLPIQNQLQTLGQEVADLQRRLREGQRTLSQAAQLELQSSIDSKTKQGRRLEEDLQEDSQRAQNALLARLSEKMGSIIQQYAQQNGISLIVPVNPQSPPIYVGPGVNITQAVVQIYDQKHPVATAPAAANQDGTGN